MFLRFLLVGGVGFVIDAGLTYLLISFKIDPSLARIPAILFAVTFTWLANRYFTYKVRITRSVNEAIRYAMVAVAMATLNYLIYLELVGHKVWPIFAVTVATAIQATISFYAYRLFVFKTPR